MEKRIVVPRIVVRPLLPPPLEIGARIRPQWLHWQVGRYREKLSFGPGGEGRAKVWVPEREGEQHNMILDQFYDSLVPQYGFTGSSVYAAVGTGSTAPAPTQTQLANEIGSAGVPRRTNRLPPGAKNDIEPLATHGEYNILRSVEFTESEVGGLNLTEWGFSPVNTYNGPLMTRELFRDGLGNPIVLTLAPDQQLRMTYRYKVALSPTTPQAVSVNIGGDGPGIRTAKFTLTGMFSTRHGINPYAKYYYGIYLASGADVRQRRGDLLVADTLARGLGYNTDFGLGMAVVSTQAAPLTYIHSVEHIGDTSTGAWLTYEPPSGRSRRASAMLGAADHRATVKSVILSANLSSIASSYGSPAANLVFDNGQEFTKDDLHKLLIAYWQITWGP